MAQAPTVLIVDDDPAIRKMLLEVLSLEGYATETATNGREALDLLEHAGPRIILLDLLMPVLDGRGMLEALRADPAVRAQHKVVLVSAWANLEAAHDLAPDALLPKPFTVMQLINVIEPLAAALPD